MLFSGNMLVEIFSDGIKKEKYTMIRNNRKEGEELNKKNIYILIYDQEVYIKKFDLPKAKGEKLYSLVKNELGFSIGSINNILFDYKIIKKKKNHVEVLVFYINSHKIEYLNQNIINSNIRRVSLIQFVIYNYYKNIIEDDNFILIFSHLQCLYILAVSKGNLVANMIIKDFKDESENITSSLEIFFNNYHEQTANIKKIYISNHYDTERNLSEFIECSITYLVNYDMNKVLNKFLKI